MSYITPENIQKGIHILEQGHLFIFIYIDALFIIDRIGSQPSCLSTEEWIVKRWCICTMKCYSAVITNETMKFKQMDRTIIILVKVTQTHTHTHKQHCKFSPILHVNF